MWINISDESAYQTMLQDQLFKLMDVPASRLWPEYFDVAFKKSQGKFDLERWMKAKQDTQRGNGPTTSLPSSSAASITAGPSVSSSFSDRPIDIEVKRIRDPRERIKVNMLEYCRSTTIRGFLAYPQCLLSDLMVIDDLSFGYLYRLIA